MIIFTLLWTTDCRNFFCTYGREWKIKLKNHHKLESLSVHVWVCFSAFFSFAFCSLLLCIYFNSYGYYIKINRRNELRYIKSHDDDDKKEFLRTLKNIFLFLFRGNDYCTIYFIYRGLWPYECVHFIGNKLFVRRFCIVIFHVMMMSGITDM